MTHPDPAAALLDGYYADADALVSRGVASAAHVDTSMRLGAGYAAGPFAARGIAVGDAAETDSGTETPWSKVAVLGTGRMATGIAEAIARAGGDVVVVARSEASAARSNADLSASLDRSVARGRLSAEDAAATMRRTSFVPSLSALPPVDLVVEAVAEDLAVKQTLMVELDRTLAPAVPIATNTSSYRVAEVMSRVGPDRPVLALHFFNPAPAMRLVEIIPGPHSAHLVPLAEAWVRSLRKTPVRSADERGFIVNRLLIPYLNDAVRLHESGISIELIDESLVAEAGVPMGPFALIDLIGLDVTVAALSSMAETSIDERLRPAATLHAHIAAGRLGRKSGAGFYREGE
ncbi:3-hydroxyacyl-CoA dehydrogenase family protein [Microbacterium album]|uniref:3-hydroxybutyryl-CoA dehydrogenase n=1 Tax=Microbacterium album TaxID=2053191 RepID=A0A917IHJ6_9MICO|nr:3-hydroxyacyl-CoA dehydrogenase family protein [Microbacterium album]GGH47304.1 hypothetical protein GCM10010921_23930 [Microbacterium album]